MNGCRSPLAFLAGFVLVCLLSPAASAIPFTVPEAELLGAEWSAAAWGDSLTRSDLPGPAVRFTFDLPAGVGAGVKDDYPVAPAYGQVIPSHANGDFSPFDAFRLWVTNESAPPVLASLFINTGFTGPSGFPSNNPANDTFWQSPWTELAPGVPTLLQLSFNNAIPYHVEDNPPPHTQGGTDGVAMPINALDITEVDAIGLQLYSPGGARVELAVEPYVIPEPATLLLLGVSLGPLACVRLRRRR